MQPHPEGALPSGRPQTWATGCLVVQFSVFGSLFTIRLSHAQRRGKVTVLRCSLSTISLVLSASLGFPFSVLHSESWGLLTPHGCVLPTTASPFCGMAKQWKDKERKQNATGVNLILWLRRETARPQHLECLWDPLLPPPWDCQMQGDRDDTRGPKGSSPLS